MISTRPLRAAALLSGPVLLLLGGCSDGSPDRGAASAPPAAAAASTAPAASTTPRATTSSAPSPDASATASLAPSAGTPSPPSSEGPGVPVPQPPAFVRKPWEGADRPGNLLRSVFRFKTGSEPKQVAWTPDQRELWVAPLGSTKGLEVYDAATGERTHLINLGKHGAVEVIFDRAGTTAYVSQMWTASVFAIDTRTYRVRRQYKTGGSWTKVMALSPDEKTIYAANWSSDDVSAINLETGAVRKYPTVRTPRGLYPTPDGTRLYVAGYDDGQIQVLDLASGKGKVLLETGGAMRHIAGDPERLRLYADDMAKNVVFVVDMKTDKVSTLAKTDNLPNTIDLSPDGKVLYVSNRGRNGADYTKIGPEWGSVVVIDALTGKHLDALVGGNQTTGLEVSPDGKWLAFTEFLDNWVKIYEIPPYEEYLAGGGGRWQAHKAELDK